MKGELDLTPDELAQIQECLTERGWIHHGEHWRAPHTGMAFTIHTAAKLAGCYPGDENDSGHTGVVGSKVEAPGQPGQTHGKSNNPSDGGAVSEQPT